jgi:uncharacterized membrane protein
MRKLKLLALALIVLGVVVLAIGAAYGQGEFFLLLFIPVYKGEGPLALGGGLLIFLGIVVGLGPIPIVWGSDAKTTLYAIIIGTIIVTTVLVAIFLYFVFNSAFP